MGWPNNPFPIHPTFKWPDLELRRKANKVKWTWSAKMPVKKVIRTKKILNLLINSIKSQKGSNLLQASSLSINKTNNFKSIPKHQAPVSHSVWYRTWAKKWIFSSEEMVRLKKKPKQPKDQQESKPWWQRKKAQRQTSLIKIWHWKKLEPHWTKASMLKIGK